MINKYDKGGLNIRDVKSHIEMLHISWIKRLIDTTTNDANWKLIPKMIFDTYGKDFLILRMNIHNYRNIPKIDNIPDFYLEIVEAWIK